jgi:hypothetical protein
MAHPPLYSGKDLQTALLISLSPLPLPPSLLSLSHVVVLPLTTEAELQRLRALREEISIAPAEVFPDACYGWMKNEVSRYTRTFALTERGADRGAEREREEERCDSVCVMVCVCDGVCVCDTVCDGVCDSVCVCV